MYRVGPSYLLCSLPVKVTAYIYIRTGLFLSVFGYRVGTPLLGRWWHRLALVLVLVKLCTLLVVLGKSRRLLMMMMMIVEKGRLSCGQQRQREEPLS